MTIGIGLASKEWIILAADSAVTHGESVKQTLSSLGETSDATGGVEEAALKIVPLGTHAAATIAGTALDALDALVWIKPHLATGDFVKMWTDAMSAKDHLSFEILVARWHCDAPELYRCIGRHAERVRPGLPVIIGSVEDGERSTLETRTRVMLVRGHQPQMIQLGTCALLVWRAFNEVGFKDHIGGTPASLVVNANGLAWMPDTSVYAVDVRPGPDGKVAFHGTIHRVSVLGREDVVAVSSTYTNETRLLANPATAESLPSWREKWLDEVLDVARRNSVKLVALVALIQRRLALLELDLCQNKYIKVESDQVIFGDELKSFFLGPPPTLPGGAVYSIPLGEPDALRMADAGGPADLYDLELGLSFILVAADIDQRFDDAFRVWESLLGRHPLHSEVLKAGLIAAEAEPGMPRLDRALSAWESALTAEPALVGSARFAATRHPDAPEVARRLLAAIKATEGSD